jgi:predicted GNAT superfamily acetyltransferase
MTENTIHSQFGEITFDSIDSIPNDALLEELVDLSISLFENKPNHKYFSVLKQKPALMLLARNCNNTLIACKIGYQYSEDVFYSWIGGVHTKFRKHGIAKHLMYMQHEWCRNQNFRMIRTKTLFNNSIMYALNVKNGFSIIGNDISGKHGPKLIYSKLLSSHPQDRI